MTIPNFPPDYPGAIVFPAHVTNAYDPLAHGSPNKPKAFILHTPEEPADDYPSTPHWFARFHPQQAGSTHYFASFKGQIWQCVPERWGAIANGLDGKPRPSWAGAGSLNFQTLSVEIEGYAANIGQTLQVGGAQWKALIALIKHRCATWNIPLDRQHIMGHYELSVNRSDPGATFPWAALMAEFAEEDDMTERVWCQERFQTWLVGKGGAYPVTNAEDDKRWTAIYGPHTKVMTGAQLDALKVK